MKTQRLYRFGNFEINAKERSLYRNGKMISLAPKVFDTLLILVERNHEIVLKEELMEALWPGAFVEESNLTQNIYRLRQVFGKKNRFIKTLPKRGYRFEAEVSRIEEPTNVDSGSVPPKMPQPTLEDSQREPSETHEQNSPEVISEPTIPADRRKSLQKIALLRIGLAALVLISVVGVGAYGYYSWGKEKTNRKVPLESVTFSEVSNTGDIVRAAISPDGKLISFIRRNPGKKGTLWLRDSLSGDELPLRIPDKLDPRFLSFTANGNQIYFSSKSTDGTGFDLYRTSKLGGKVELVTEAMTGAFGMSWDGTNTAYYKRNENEGKVSLIVRDNGTGEERVVLSKSFPDEFRVNVPPAWSADSKGVFATVQKRGSVESDISQIDVKQGSEVLIKIPGLLQMGAVVALEDGNTLILTAREKRAHHQLYKYKLRDSSLRRLSNDVGIYRHLARSKDGEALVATQNSTFSNIWFFPKKDSANGKQLTFGKSNRDGVHGITALGKNSFVYISMEGKSRDLWSFNINSGNRTRLTKGVGANRQFPFATRKTGNVFVGVFENKGFGINRISSKGGPLTSITSQARVNDIFPNVSPNEDKLFFIRKSKGKAAIIERLLEEGKERELKLPEGMVPDRHLAISPDGKYLAFRTKPKKSSSASDNMAAKVGILEIDKAEEFSRLIDIEAGNVRFRWSEDSESIVFVRQSPKKAMLWRQSIRDKTAPEKVMEIPKLVFDFEINEAGDVIAAVGERLRDMVMVKDFAD